MAKVFFLNDDSDIIRDALHSLMGAKNEKAINDTVTKYQDYILDHPALRKALDNAVMRVLRIKQMKRKHIQYMN